jgi:lipooligosaccharide transport system ATP-binding protein
MFTIETINLVKKFKTLTAVNDVSISIEAGECFGLLGPNGAGKTTLIRMITAVSPPVSGKVYILGRDLAEFPRDCKSQMGVVPQLDNLDPDLTVRQNLLTFARYFNIPAEQAKKRSEEVLRLFELQNRGGSGIKELSGGMKRRLLIARGLINNPAIIILDEPTVGLDPQARVLVWQKLAELKAGGVTQLLSTQNMEEAAALCDRVAMMDQGKVRAVNSPANLVARYAGKRVVELSVPAGDGEALGRDLTAIGADYEQHGNNIYIYHDMDLERLKRILPSADDIRTRPATLEDVFFRISGRSLSE